MNPANDWLDAQTHTNILGNGASINLYTPNSHRTIACNVPQHGHAYDYLSIIDQQPVVWMSNNAYTPSVPVFCSEKALNSSIKHSVAGDWIPAYDNRHRTNSAHWAVWLLCEYTSKEIHLWGMDSMFSDNLTSQMDNLVPRSQRPNLNKEWRPIWREIFAKQPIQYYIHTPKLANLPDYGDNVHQICH